MRARVIPELWLQNHNCHPDSLVDCLLRTLGSPFLGIRALNWTARNLEPSPAHKAIILANTIGFSVAALVDV
jgi:hypothetical protein